MHQIKQLGLPGVIMALTIFCAGFWVGALFRAGVMPVAHSTVPERTPVAAPIVAPEIVKLASEVAGMREQMTRVVDTLERIEAKLSSRR